MRTTFAAFMLGMAVIGGCNDMQAFAAGIERSRAGRNSTLSSPSDLCSPGPAARFT